MAINRYSKPIEHQYMPTTPNPQIVAMMLQKKAADTATAQQQRNTLESNVLGIKAYGQEDSGLLKQKQDHYSKSMSKIYEDYKGDSNSILYAMNELNREFTRDTTSGDLYNINQKYLTAQSDIKHANEEYGKGNLTEGGHRWQIANAGTGQRAQKNPEMFDKLHSQINTIDYSKSVFAGDYDDAVANAESMFAGQFKTQISYMNEEELANAKITVGNIVADRFRASGRSLKSKYTKYDQSSTPEGFTKSKDASRVTDPDSAQYGIGELPMGLDKSFVYDDSGNVKQEAKDHYNRLLEAQKKQAEVDQLGFFEKRKLSNDEFAPFAYEKDKIVKETSNLNYADWLSKQVKAKGDIPELRTFTPEGLNTARENYGLPANWSDEQVSEYATNEINKHATEFGTSFRLDPGKKNQFLPPKLIDENDKVMTLYNKVVYVDGVKTDGADVEEMLLKAIDDGTAGGMQDATTGEMPIHSVDGVAGSMRYRVNINGKGVNIDVVSDDPDIVNAATAVHNILEARSTGQVGLKNPIPGTGGIVDEGIYDANGNPTSESYDSVAIIPTFQEKDDEGNIINKTTYENVAIKNGKYVYVYDENGKKGPLEIDMNGLVNMTYGLIREHYRNPNID